MEVVSTPEVEALPFKLQIMIQRILFVLLFSISSIQVYCQEYYREYYRPQFHLSAQHGWMGDPNGMIFFNGRYHLLWWGHALSNDLVHWTQYNNNAMSGGPGGFGYWSGSVVADINNTAGFNTAEDTALVAVYTMHYNTSGIEKVGISSSLNHIGFQYYEGNPVINVDQTDFRDPQVFWYEPSNRWIMVITRSLERAIEIYSSSDLKSWEYLSSFNTNGGKSQVWEVPDLFQLPLNNDTLNMKWVMTCGMGPNRVQYWVGNFDGTTFTVDTTDNIYTGLGITGEIFEDFEDGYAGWTITGDAFGTQPATGTLAGQQEVSGWAGNAFINTFLNGDASTGTITSSMFTIEKPFINFLIGGGTGTGLRFNIKVNGNTVISVRPSQNQEILRWKGVDVSPWLGQSAIIEIIDESTSGWGHILLDHIVFSEELYDSGNEHANWVDDGRDFYAARSYRNYSPNTDRKVWIGWMGNWTYANDVPTSPWRGHQAMPRTLKLINEGSGYDLIQEPLTEFEQLRKDHYTLEPQLVDGVKEVDGFKPGWNVYELKASFKITGDSVKFGLTLADGGGSNKLIIGYDTHTSRVYVDRRNAGTTNFNQAFPTVMYGTIPYPEDSIVTLHIFMDQSSVEVFTDDYKKVISALVFTKPSATGITIFSENGATRLISFDAWKMESIWGVTPGELPNAIPEKNKKGEGLLFPNPLTKDYDLGFNSTEKIHIGHGVVTITDIMGREVFSQQITNQYLSEIRVKNLTSKITGGSYLVHLTSNEYIFAGKLVIQN